MDITVHGRRRSHTSVDPLGLLPPNSDIKNKN